MSGRVSPGNNHVGQLTVIGNVTFDSDAILNIEIAGTSPDLEYDRLQIHTAGAGGGVAHLGGTVAVSLLDGFMPQPGDQFEILTAGGGIVGGFLSGFNLPALDDAFWSIGFGLNSITLDVIADLGDYNFDNVVNAADYAVWRDNLGGIYDLNDYATWKTNFGATISGPFTNSVPEPLLAHFIAAGFIASFLLVGRRRLRQLASWRRRHIWCATDLMAEDCSSISSCVVASSNGAQAY